MVRIPTHRPPTHPGEMLREEFLVPMNISQRDLASAIHVPYQRVNELVNQRRGVTPSTALRLEKFFGVSADFWLNLQVRWDLFKAQSSEAEELRSIEHYHHLRKWLNNLFQIGLGFPRSVKVSIIANVSSRTPHRGKGPAIAAAYCTTPAITSTPKSWA